MVAEMVLQGIGSIYLGECKTRSRMARREVLIQIP